MVLLIDQNTVAVLAIAHRGYVLEVGRVVISGSGWELGRRRPDAAGLSGHGLTGWPRLAFSRSGVMGCCLGSWFRFWPG
ncbi:hypothetical protein DFAR_2230010 [Desulfarculales bacterium]